MLPKFNFLADAMRIINISSIVYASFQDDFMTLKLLGGGLPPIDVKH
jgi:hypothetical protein